MRPTRDAEEVDHIITAMPKAELHVHLEGSVRPATFLQLARRAGIDGKLGCTDELSVARLFEFRDFNHFMELYGACTFAFKAPEDFALVAEQLGEDAASNGVRYMEVTFTAGTHNRFKGIPFDEMIQAVSAGAEAARKSTGIVMRFIVDHVRGFPVEDCFQTAQWCVEGKEHGVVALGLAGFEPDNPASLYRDAILWAQEQGVVFVPHAGEAVGPAGVWDALEFNPPRVGHGFRSAEDATLMRTLRDRAIALEVCPTSNVCTGNIDDLGMHPLRRLWSAGVPVTLNTDDPQMFNTTLTEEYRIAALRFGFTVEELAEISLNAVRFALMHESERIGMVRQFEDEFANLGLELSGITTAASS
jgi:adenosine deaminase